MNKRTKDSRYKPCPICGRKPRVGFYQIWYGWANCDGGFFKKHKKIHFFTNYQQPSKLYDVLINGWNEQVERLE